MFDDKTLLKRITIKSMTGSYWLFSPSSGSSRSSNKIGCFMYEAGYYDIFLQLNAVLKITIYSVLSTVL